MQQIFQLPLKKWCQLIQAVELASSATKNPSNSKLKSGCFSWMLSGYRPRNGRRASKRCVKKQGFEFCGAAQGRWRREDLEEVIRNHGRISREPARIGALRKAHKLG